MIKPIITDKKILHEVCEEVRADEMREVIADLYDTAADLKRSTGYGCAGLAAPQIGHKKRVVLVNVQAKTTIMVNPEIILTKGKYSWGNESCFSVPSTFVRAIRIKRWFKIKVVYTNEDNVLISKLFKGFDARLIQHELDHLDGKLISD